MFSHRKGAVVGSVLCAAASALGSPAHAVNEKQIVAPSILLTTYAGAAAVVLPALERPAGTMVVGFNNLVISAGFRGSVTFRTRDIPHHFVHAILVLTSKDAGAQVGLTFADTNLVAALFETPSVPASGFEADDSPVTISDPTSSPGLALTIEQATSASPGRASVTVEETDGLAPVAQDPTLQDQVYLTAGNPKVQRTGANYRLDVTERVQKWVADWPNHLKSSTHGFIFVGINEVNPAVTLSSNVELWAHYEVTLEFDIDAPDF